MCVCIYTYMKTIESSCYKEKIYSHGKGVCKVALIRRFNSKLFHDIHLVFIYESSTLLLTSFLLQYLDTDVVTSFPSCKKHSFKWQNIL